jgi:hypothetical protein
MPPTFESEETHYRMQEQEAIQMHSLRLQSSTKTKRAETHQNKAFLKTKPKALYFTFFLQISRYFFSWNFSSLFSHSLFHA